MQRLIPVYHSLARSILMYLCIMTFVSEINTKKIINLLSIR